MNQSKLRSVTRNLGLAGKRAQTRYDLFWCCLSLIETDLLIPTRKFQGTPALSANSANFLLDKSLSVFEE